MMVSAEKALLAALPMALILSGCSGVARNVEPVALENTNWIMQLPEKSDCDTPPVLEFLPDNRLSGDLGCNRAAGSFEFDGQNILFNKVGVTRKMCAPQYMELESKMLDLLQHARTVSKSDKGLTFYDADGNEIMTLVPEEAGACY